VGRGWAGGGPVLAAVLKHGDDARS